MNDTAVQECASRELEWLLSSLDETISAVRSGLEECLALLDNGPASTLPVSSSRSESLKGTVTRVGGRITQGNMSVKMAGLAATKGFPAYRLTLVSPMVLGQLVDVRNCVVASMELLGPADAKDAVATMARLRELHDNVLVARAALKGASPHMLFPFRAVDPKAFDPPLPPVLAFDLYISEAALVAEVRTLESLAPPDSAKSAFSVPSLDITSPFGFRERFAAAVGFRGHAQHDSATGVDEVFEYKGANVKLRESVKVESQDPSLMAVWAKLGGIEHVLEHATKALEMVMVVAAGQSH